MASTGNAAYYLGPKLMGVLVEAILTGMMINQSVTFWDKAERGRFTLQALVGVVTIIALFQTGISFYSIWQACVTNFGDWVATIAFTWCEKSQSLITNSLAVPVQAFLIWRCWMLLSRRWYVLVPLTLMLLASIITSIIVTVQTFSIPDSWWYIPTPAPPEVPISSVFILSLASSAVLDVAVTGILLTYLARAKPTIISSRFRRVMKRLTILVWEAAIPPCVCAIVTVILYSTQASDNYWDLGFQAVLGKLYVVSLFVTLNGRASLHELPDHMSVVTCQCHCHAQSRYHATALFTPSDHIRLDMSHDVPPLTPCDGSPTDVERSSLGELAARERDIEKLEGTPNS
ncbi:hypothetical protein SCP_0412490 [Sparassis crispa]|uniref:DUF6534 domain-containing protein n=1 Tax=Sparassis crispa TaxID=139825 RepID=A0A401GL43_9APHY|nr:hypothetical protein SCP_0412490 [Sparassis crispa]GBE82862.1 hypothetical protein SCP_0412490 [Sparassis crispa]